MQQRKLKISMEEDEFNQDYPDVVKSQELIENINDFWRQRKSMQNQRMQTKAQIWRQQKSMQNQRMQTKAQICREIKENRNINNDRIHQTVEERN